MSLLITTDISCDGDDCGDWTHGTCGMRTDAKFARKEARRAGWTRKGTLDYCPRCSKKGTQREAETQDR